MGLCMSSATGDSPSTPGPSEVIRRLHERVEQELAHRRRSGHRAGAIRRAAGTPVGSDGPAAQPAGGLAAGAGDGELLARAEPHSRVGSGRLVLCAAFAAVALAAGAGVGYLYTALNADETVGTDRQTGRGTMEVPAGGQPRHNNQQPGGAIPAEPAQATSGAPRPVKSGAGPAAHAGGGGAPAGSPTAPPPSPSDSPEPPSPSSSASSAVSLPPLPDGP